jgi:hypothetical protein
VTIGDELAGLPNGMYQLDWHLKSVDGRVANVIRDIEIRDKKQYPLNAV